MSKRINTGEGDPTVPGPSQRLNAQVAGVDYGVLDELIGYALRRAQIRIYQDFLETMAAWSITPPRFSAMTLLDANVGMKLTELANAMGIARSGAVQVVHALEKLGHVKRTDSEVDRRAHSLALTASGSAALRSIRRAIRQHDERISTRLSEDEKKELRRLLDLLG